ncbi:hypothetical protein I4674_19165 [Proteus mirabilis]|nr:hypothetical protein [Proteus mirabilis]
MPVDLSSLPPKAERYSLPSIKVWVKFLIFLLCLINFVNYFIFPTLNIKKISVLQVSFLTFLGWTTLCFFRYLFYILHQFIAEGWDKKREEDRNNMIVIGQRYVTLLSQAMILPYLASCKDLSTQIAIAKSSLLPSYKLDNKIIYCSQFTDIEHNNVTRIINRLNKLLIEPSLISKIYQLPDDVKFKIIISSNHSNLSDDEKLEIDAILAKRIERAYHISYTAEVKIDLIDNWLDNPKLFDFLLLINIYSFNNPINYHSEVATAQLFSFSNLYPINGIAKIHRPELVEEKNTFDLFNQKVETVAIWSALDKSKLKNIWLTMLQDNHEDETKAKVLSSDISSHITLNNINSSIGYTHIASPWVNIYISTTQLIKEKSPQLLIDKKNILIVNL